MKTIISVMVFCFSSLAIGGDHEHMPVKVSPAFEKMKTLLGTWEGKTSMNGKEETIQATYELTSGGTAIVEKLNPGTPMEMVTMYANNGSKVNATHYCALGNQPQLEMKNSKDNQFAFEMVGTKGISSKKEMHMHAVTITVDGNKLTSEWTNFKDGKKNDTVKFELTKKI